MKKTHKRLISKKFILFYYMLHKKRCEKKMNYDSFFLLKIKITGKGRNEAPEEALFWNFG